MEKRLISLRLAYKPGECNWFVQNLENLCLLALLHLKADCWQSAWMRSADPTGMKAVSTSAMECMTSWIWHVEILLIYCSLEVSSCNDSSCHQIKTPQAKTLGLPQCNDFPHYKFFLHRNLFWKFIQIHRWIARQTLLKTWTSTMIFDACIRKAFNYKRIVFVLSCFVFEYHFKWLYLHYSKEDFSHFLFHMTIWQDNIK